MPTHLLDRERPAPPAVPEVVVRVTGDDHGGRRGPRTRLSLGGVLSAAVLGAIALVVVLVLGSLTGFIDIENPFGATTVDNSPPVVLKKLVNLSEFHAAQGQYVSTIDEQTSVSFIPEFLVNDHTVFIAKGSVDATVDFSRLTKGAVTISPSRSVTITLPPPHLGKAVIDPKESHVATHDRGLWNRELEAFAEDPSSEHHFYVLGAKKIEKAARHSGLIRRARHNTVTMLHGLLRELGFDDVHVVFSTTAPLHATR
jgi:hypothetical protein